MGGFFHGWHRKLGVLTLVMACMVTGIWVRSYVVTDTFIYGNTRGGDTFVDILPNGIEWWAMNRACTYGIDSSFMGIVWNSRPCFGHGESMPFDNWNDVWTWSCFGFQFGEANQPNEMKRKMLLKASDDDETDEPDATEMHELDAEVLEELGDRNIVFWKLPYWSIVIPMTILSAYLLLSKPRKTTLKKSAEPSTANGE